MIYCKNCGTQLEDGSTFCSNCGSPVSAAEPAPEKPPVSNPVPSAEPAAAPDPAPSASAPYQAPNYQQQPPYPPQGQQQYGYNPPPQGQQYATTVINNMSNIPLEYKPLGAWAYFGYNLLFAIPLVGFILLIVFACGGAKNINLRNYARSFFCMYILIAIIVIILVIVGFSFAGFLGF